MGATCLQIVWPSTKRQWPSIDSLYLSRDSPYPSIDWHGSINRLVNLMAIFS